MALNNEIFLYRKASLTYPLFIEPERSGFIAEIWKLKDAPLPPENTLLRQYTTHAIYFQQTFVGSAITIVACEETIGEKLVFTTEEIPIIDVPRIIRVGRDLFTVEPGTAFAEKEQRFGTPALVSGQNRSRSSARFACTLITRLTLIGDVSNFTGKSEGDVIPIYEQTIVSGQPTLTIRLPRESVKQIIGTQQQRELLARQTDDPQIINIVAIHPIEKLQDFWTLTPPATQPAKLSRVPIPRDPRPPATPTKCFDRSTGEEVDCKTGEPKERSPCEEEFIKIPTAEDIIHMKPRPKLPWGKKIDPLTGKERFGFTRTLTRLEAEEFIRRREIRESIRRSPAPEFARTVARIMTWIDDVQDGLLTVIVLARLGITRLPKGFYNALLVGTGVAEALQFVSTFGLSTIHVRAVKTRLEREARARPFDRNWKTRARDILKRRMPTLGEVLQVLQTTDQLFGIGISLGPILGFVLDLFYGLKLDPKFDPTQDPFPILGGRLPFRIEPKIGYRDPCLDEIRFRAIRNMERMGAIPLGSVPPLKRLPFAFEQFDHLFEPLLRGTPYEEILTSPLVSGSPQLPAAPFTQAEYLQVLVSYSTFLDLFEKSTEGADLDPLFDIASQRPVVAWPEESRTEDVLSEAGDTLSPPGQGLPIPGNPTEASVDQVFGATHAGHVLGLHNHINLDPSSIPSFYIRQVAADIAHKTGRILDPESKDPTYTLTEPWKTLHLLLDQGFIPPRESTGFRVNMDVETIRTLRERSPSRQLKIKETEKFIRQRGWKTP